MKTHSTTSRRLLFQALKFSAATIFLESALTGAANIQGLIEIEGGKEITRHPDPWILLHHPHHFFSKLQSGGCYFLLFGILCCFFL